VTTNNSLDKGIVVIDGKNQLLTLEQLKAYIKQLACQTTVPLGDIIIPTFKSIVNGIFQATTLELLFYLKVA
jgi:hypothetical protein